jgi:putative flavoprotein involved in K+ transport
VIWCTGYGNGLSWIDLPIFEANGEPRHESGIAIGERGLYFVGLHFLHSLSSTMIHGIARDAKRIADTIERRTNAAEIHDIRDTTRSMARSKALQRPV